MVDESDPKTRTTKLTPGLIAAIAAACAVAAPVTQKWEGKRNAAYYDPAHIATICWGHTGTEVRMGMLWSDDKCHLVFTKDQERLGISAARCTPSEVIRNPQMMGSVVDFAFNSGPGHFCKSSMMRNFWLHQYDAGCRSYMLYIYATDRRFNPPHKIILPGLKGRRVDETAMCLKGLPQ